MVHIADNALLAKTKFDKFTKRKVWPIGLAI